MSSGHHAGHHVIRKEHTEQIEHLLRDNKFISAVRGYSRIDDKHDIPFLGGSDNSGRVVYFDRNFSKALTAGAIRYNKQPYDPSQFVYLHEAVEGALIRHYGLDYTQAHDLATAAERHAVETLGLNWAKHQNAMKPWIKRDEHERVTNPPPNLLKIPYDNTPQAAEVGDTKGGYVPGRGGKSDSFLLIRHGATPLNKENSGGPDRIRGWRDVPLSAHGHQEAQNLAQQLSGSGLKVIVHSDLSRARDTAAPIAKATGAKLVPSSMLRPWHVGVFTGKESNEAHPELARYAEREPDRPVPQGESFNSFKRRAFSGLRGAIQGSNGAPLAIVTHHRVERLFHACRPDGSVDFKKFFSHGESPATCQVMPHDHCAVAHAHAGSTASKRRMAPIQGGYAPAQKLSHKAVDYSLGMASSHCGICRYYSNRHCDLVADPIDPKYWCTKFKKQSA